MLFENIKTSNITVMARRVPRLIIQVNRDGQRVKLTRTERAVLSTLLKYRNQVVTHETLLLEAWGEDCVESRSYLYSYISRLRAKLEIDPREPRHIMTCLGEGYTFRTEDNK